LEDGELREYGDGFEEDGEGPEEFLKGVSIVEDEGKERRGEDEVLNTEGVKL
jgi:hypothetical protein